MKNASYSITGTVTVPPGGAEGMIVTQGGCGTANLFVDNAQVASGRIDQTVPVRVSADETFDIGEDNGTPSVAHCRP